MCGVTGKSSVQSDCLWKELVLQPAGTNFYTCTVESILTGCITAWFGNSTTDNRKALQRVVRTARHIVGGELLKDYKFYFKCLI